MGSHPPCESRRGLPDSSTPPPDFTAPPAQHAALLAVEAEISASLSTIRLLHTAVTLRQQEKELLKAQIARVELVCARLVRDVDTRLHAADPRQLSHHDVLECMVEGWVQP